jgi:hypothetical protein
MNKFIFRVITLVALTSSSMCFAWDRDNGWRHHGGYRERSYVEHIRPSPFYMTIPKPYYTSPREYGEQPRGYYGHRYQIQQPVIIPYQYRYRSH